jgi:hypothetical protein
LDKRTLYKDGVKELIQLSKEISDVYRQMHEITEQLKECNAESVLFDTFYLQELIMKRDGLANMYEQMLVQICINNCFDMKSWKAGQYSYDRDEVVSWVSEFNARYHANVSLEAVIKSLRFDYGMDIELSRAER